MIFDLFLAFAFLSCVFIFLGYYTKPSIKVLAVLGFGTLFFLGMILQFSGLETVQGHNETYSYKADNVTINTVSSVNTYQAVSDQTSLWVGRWLSIVSIMGMVLVFTSNREKEEA